MAKKRSNTIKFYSGINTEHSKQNFLTPPSFEFFTYENQLENDSLVSDLLTNIYEYEVEVKKRQKLLPREHREFVLNYYRLYNLFSDFDKKELNTLNEVINQISKELLKKLNLELKIQETQSWINILRKGEQAPRHCHIIKNEKSISWVLFLNDSQTNLNLESPHMIYDGKDVRFNTYITVLPKKGKIIFFPSWLYHFTDIHKESNPRISIAGKFILDTL